MSPGAVDTAGQVAGSAIDALKSTPVVLALVIFNVLYMVGTFYTNIKEGERYDKAADRWKGVVETTMKYCPQQPQIQLKPTQKWVLQSDESHPEVPEETPPEAIPLPPPRPADAPP